MKKKDIIILSVVISVPVVIFTLLFIFSNENNVSTYKKVDKSISTSTRSIVPRPVKKEKDGRILPYSRYYALVVGIGTYKSKYIPTIKHAYKDGIEIKETLENIGFEKVEYLPNPTSKELRDALYNLVGKNSDYNSAVLIYYAGHGEIVDGIDGKKVGYILPSDVPSYEEDSAGFSQGAISTAEITTIATLIKARHVLMVLDSCFAGAMFSQVRSIPKSIKEKINQLGRQFITSGSADETVPNFSHFKEFFIAGIKDKKADLNKDGYVTASELGLYLQDKVINHTDGKQHPQFGKIINTTSNSGDFVFFANKYNAGADNDITIDSTDVSEEGKAEGLLSQYVSKNYAL